MSLLLVGSLLIIHSNLLAYPPVALTFILAVKVALGVRDFLGWRVRDPVAAVLLAVFAIGRVVLDAALAGFSGPLLGPCARFLLTARIAAPPWRR